jgi:hypothetical protein
MDDTMKSREHLEDKTLGGKDDDDEQNLGGKDDDDDDDEQNLGGKKIVLRFAFEVSHAPRETTYSEIRISSLNLPIALRKEPRATTGKPL